MDGINIAFYGCHNQAIKDCWLIRLQLIYTDLELGRCIHIHSIERVISGIFINADEFVVMEGTVNSWLQMDLPVSLVGFLGYNIIKCI